MRALILVDIQNDFLPGGTLAVPQGDEVVAVANELMPQYDLVVATQDWHPADHQSFARHHPGSQVGDVIELHGLPQVLWPVHCVQGTSGADFSPRLNLAGIQHVVQKGTDREVDSYSGFFDNARRRATGLEKLLRENRVEDVHVLGLATDYCVRATAIDAVDLGFRVTLIERGCRGVELKRGDCQQAIDEMRQAGVTIQ
ncbi:bifunctional nicotinamidase/pyrazinamidase [Anatilimnocola floriformis]|uniref:bifunctional nicotinamidase/pyrazinamidase n=1 Tax=Anatilimnocola floriformis TaxID=2948575 RepID=UPI0020C3D1A1|nr:bifunctional nicotinamidase/pyrazinamidase [Anatilimnocola floriformis]